jgi:hypothetical protein
MVLRSRTHLDVLRHRGTNSLHGAHSATSAELPRDTGVSLVEILVAVVLLGTVVVGTLARCGCR